MCKSSIFKKYLNEVAIFLFLFARFILRNYVNRVSFFTENAVFGAGDAAVVSVRLAVAATACLLLAVLLGSIVRKSYDAEHDAAALFVLFVLACPVSFPMFYRVSAAGAAETLYPFFVFISAFFIIDKPIIKWMVPFLTALFSFSAYIADINPLFDALYNSAALYVPLLLIQAGLYAFGSDILSSGNKKERAQNIKKDATCVGSTENRLIFAACLVIALAGFICRRISGLQIMLSYQPRETVVGGVIVVLPMLLIIVCFYICLLREKGREHFFSFLCSVLSVLLILCVINRRRLCSQGIPLILISQMIIMGFVLVNSGAEYNKALGVFSSGFKSKPLVTAIMLAFMAMFSMASYGTVSAWLSGLVVY